MKRIGKWMRSALLATCDACDVVVTIVTGDAYPQRREDYGVALVVGLLGLLFVLAAVLALVGCLAAFMCVGFAAHPVGSCAVLGLMAMVATAAWAAGKLRRYVGERFEKERR